MAFNKILNENIVYVEEMWELFTEEEKKSKIGILIGAIKRMIMTVFNFIRDKWNKFVSKHRSNKIVMSADRLFKSIASKFTKTNRVLANDNINEDTVKKLYDETREDSTKVQETAQKVVSTVEKQENKPEVANKESEQERLDRLNKGHEELRDKFGEVRQKEHDKKEQERLDKLNKGHEELKDKFGEYR